MTRQKLDQGRSSIRSLGLIFGFEADNGQSQGGFRLTPTISLNAKEIEKFFQQVLIDTLLKADLTLHNGAHKSEIMSLRDLEGEDLKAKALALRIQYFSSHYLFINLGGVPYPSQP